MNRLIFSLQDGNQNKQPKVLETQLSEQGSFKIHKTYN